MLILVGFLDTKLTAPVLRLFRHTKRQASNCAGSKFLVRHGPGAGQVAGLNYRRRPLAHKGKSKTSSQEPRCCVALSGHVLLCLCAWIS